MLSAFLCRDSLLRSVCIQQALDSDASPKAAVRPKLRLSSNCGGCIVCAQQNSLASTAICRWPQLPAPAPSWAVAKGCSEARHDSCIMLLSSYWSSAQDRYKSLLGRVPDTLCNEGCPSKQQVTRLAPAGAASGPAGAPRWCWQCSCPLGWRLTPAPHTCPFELRHGLDTAKP